MPSFIVSAPSFRTHSSNLPAPIVVDHGGNFGGASDIHVLKNLHSYINNWWLYSRRLEDCWPCNPFDFGHCPGSSTPLQCDHLLEHDVLKEILSVPLYVVPMSNAGTSLGQSPRWIDMLEKEGGRKPWTTRMVNSTGRGAYICLMDDIKTCLPCWLCQLE